MPEIGRISEAQSILEELHERAQKQYVPPFSFACCCLGLGEIDRGFEWLEKSVDEHDSVILHCHINPDFDPMHFDPRFHALLHKMNLAP